MGQLSALTERVMPLWTNPQSPIYHRLMAHLREFMSVEEARIAVCEHWENRPASAQACCLGDFLIVKPDDAELTTPAFYILGFNGGETVPRTDGKQTRSATIWFNRCRDAAHAVGVTSWLIGERAHWGGNYAVDVPRGARQNATA